MVAVSFALGFGGNLGVKALSKSVPTEPEKPEHAELLLPPAESNSLSYRIDTLIRAGCYRDALELCREESHDTHGHTAATPGHDAKAPHAKPDTHEGHDAKPAGPKLHDPKKDGKEPEPKPHADDAHSPVSFVTSPPDAKAEKPNAHDPKPKAAQPEGGKARDAHEHEPKAEKQNPPDAKPHDAKEAKPHDAHAVPGDHTAHGSGDPAMAYREGLCLEGLGRWQEAIAAYKRADSGSEHVAVWARATLAQARCLAAEGDLHAAGALLDRVVPRSGHPDCRGRRVLEECLYLRAGLELLEFAPAPLDPFNPSAIAWVPLGTRVDEYLDWFPIEPLASPAKLPADRGHAPVLVTETDAGERELTAHLADKPRALLEAIGKAAGVKVYVDPKIAERLAKDNITLDVERAPLAEVLTALVGPFEADWRVQVGTLSIEPRHESTATEQEDRVGRVLRRARDFADSHPDARAVRLNLANLDFVANRTRAAAQVYRQILDNERFSPESLQAAFNLGLLELLQQNGPAARARFLDVIDRAPETVWADYGWWWTARTHLDFAETAEARRAFETVRDGKTKLLVSAAALAGCVCALLDGDDDAAQEALHGERVANDESHIALEELFDLLLRYRKSPSEGRRERLLHGLGEVNLERAFGSVGAVLTGRGYRDAGVPNRAIGTYERATQTVRGPLALKMHMEIAERYDELNLWDQARQRYLIVMALDPAGHGPRAELRVAEFALRDRRADECVRRCLNVVGRPGIDRTKLLALLGRAYEMQGKFRDAAECFAGRLVTE